jgi:hypothetical protein
MGLCKINNMNVIIKKRRKKIINSIGYGLVFNYWPYLAIYVWYGNQKKIDRGANTK